jgi:hypothetical protein
VRNRIEQFIGDLLDARAEAVDQTGRERFAHQRA